MARARANPEMAALRVEEVSVLSITGAALSTYEAAEAAPGGEVTAEDRCHLTASSGDGENHAEAWREGMKAIREGAKCWKKLAREAFEVAKGKGKGKCKGPGKGWHKGLWNPFFAASGGVPQEHMETDLLDMLSNHMKQNWCPEEC